MLKKAAFLAAVVLCCTPWISATAALGLGLLFGLASSNPFTAVSRRASKELLKISIVGLGFGMDFVSVLQTGRISFVYTGLGIAAAMVIGMFLGRVLRVGQNPALLISVGTSICGGSAIAAVRCVLNASEDETAVSLTTIFVLNAVALLVFPLIGSAFSLTQKQFGLWAALAIHDTSSVVGAGLKYGPLALAVATTVKLVRALWIVPVTVLVASFLRGRAKTKVPWFILFFLLAAWLRSLLPAEQAVWNGIAAAARKGFCVTLFLIGAGLSVEGLKELGWRPLVQAISLWVIVAAISLILIRSGWITV